MYIATSSFYIGESELKIPLPLGEVVTRLFPLIFNTDLFPSTLPKIDVASRHITSANACETLSGNVPHQEKAEEPVL